MFSGFGGVRPNGKPPFGKFVASPRRTMPRCRRFSSAWLIDSATNQRPRRSSTSSTTLLSIFLPHTYTRVLSSPLSFSLIYISCTTTTTTITATRHHELRLYLAAATPTPPISSSSTRLPSCVPSFGAVSAINTISTYALFSTRHPLRISPSCVLFECRCRLASGCSNARYRN